MADKERFVFYLDEQEAAEWKAWIRDHFGKIDQHKSEAARLAIRELMADDTDDDLDDVHEKLDEVQARLPDEQTTHTHNDEGTDALDQMVARIDAIDGVAKDHDVDDIIIDVRGLEAGDERTLSTWRDRLRKSGEVWDSPYAPLWYTNVEPWLNNVEDADAADAEDAIDAHGLTLTEYAELCTEHGIDTGEGTDYTQSVHSSDADTTAAADGGTNDNTQTVHSEDTDEMSEIDYAQSVHSGAVDDELAALDAAEPAED